MKASLMLPAVLMMMAVSFPLYSADEGGEGGSSLRLGASWTGDMAYSLSGGLRQVTTLFGYNPFNTRWRFARGDGIMAVAEYPTVSQDS